MFTHTEAFLINGVKADIRLESLMLLHAKTLIHANRFRSSLNSLANIEFKVFSQYGDDGILQWLIEEIDIDEPWFIEFGVKDYRESTTRFLMQHNNWSGLVIDNSQRNVTSIKQAEFFYHHDLQAICEFVTTDNINILISDSGSPQNIGVLHIDIDGNDYWLWKAINVVNPCIAIIEYNAVFGAERAITVPYDKDFKYEEKHYSYLYFGASLEALKYLAKEKGYTFIGCTSAGNNAYFIRNDKLTENLRQIHQQARFGQPTLLRGNERLECIKGMEVWNVLTEKIELL